MIMSINNKGAVATFDQVQFKNLIKLLIKLWSPHRFFSRVIVGNTKELIGVLPRQERLSRTTFFRKLPQTGCGKLPVWFVNIT